MARGHRRMVQTRAKVMTADPNRSLAQTLSPAVGTMDRAGARRLDCS